MEIQTCEIEEITGEAGNLAADHEAIELINALDLEGQKSLCDEKTETRFPYPLLTKREVFVFGTVFSEKTKLSSYRAGIIPLRVLQVASFCKDFTQTKWLEVWHSPIPSQDLVLVGRAAEWTGPNYLLARWGESLESIDTLADKARTIWMTTRKQRLSKAKNELEQMRNNLEADGDMAAATGEVPTDYVHL